MFCHFQSISFVHLLLKLFLSIYLSPSIFIIFDGTVNGIAVIQDFEKSEITDSQPHEKKFINARITLIKKWIT